MKAIVMTRPGPPEVLQLREVEKPTPRDNEVLVKVHAGTVSTGDVHLRKLPIVLWPVFRLFGVRRKRIAGHDLAGEVEAVGQNVTRFKPGDRVFGSTTGLSGGANAEYVCVPEVSRTGVLAHLPANLSYAEAAPIPIGGMTAVQLLKRADIQPGQKVLIYGASGSVGSFAVQIARHYGADVTGVCSGANAEMVRALGASRVIDYTREDFTTRGETYDVILDAVGKLPAARRKKALKAGGRFLTVASPTSETNADLLFLKELAEAGQLRAAIDRTYPLAQTAEAHRLVETGRKRGNVVITVP